MSTRLQVPTSREDNLNTKDLDPRASQEHWGNFAFGKHMAVSDWPQICHDIWDPACGYGKYIKFSPRVTFPSDWRQIRLWRQYIQSRAEWSEGLEAELAGMTCFSFCLADNLWHILCKNPEPDP
jgi:hypothetical protein